MFLANLKPRAALYEYKQPCDWSWFIRYDCQSTAEEMILLTFYLGKKVAEDFIAEIWTLLK